MAQNIVTADGLCVTYRKNIKAVQNVSFSLDAGEILAVIGSNGSGKTSTVECVEGLRRPSGGSVTVFGKNPQKQRCEICKNMGVQLQEAEYPEAIRVDELCRLFAAFYDRPADRNLLLSQMKLDDKRKRTVKKLSGGEKQKLSIVLALMGRPKLLIMDEITTGLDPEARKSIITSFKNIRDSGVSIIMVSHYLEEAELLADKILYLEKGRQLFFGTKDNFRRYAESRMPEGNRKENLTLEELYLAINPETEGITMEGIK